MSIDGLQIIGPRFSEPKILAAAKFVEQMNPIGWPPIAEMVSEA